MKIKAIAWQGCYDDQWGDLIIPEAYAHPAKYSRGLIERIIQHGIERGYWKENDTIADPFGGVALGGIICGYHGLNFIGVELESKFVELGNQNLDLHRAKWAALGYSVDVRLIQGDSRRFAEIVQVTKEILTSRQSDVTIPQYEEDKNDRRNGGDVQIGHEHQPDRQGVSGQFPLCPKAVQESGYPNSDAIGSVQTCVSDGTPQGDSKIGVGPLVMEGGQTKAGLSEGSHENEMRPLWGDCKSGNTPQGHGSLQQRPTEPGSSVHILSYEDTQGGLLESPEEGRSATQKQRPYRLEAKITLLPAGNVDAVVTSPPYAESLQSESHGIDFSKADPKWGGRETPGRAAASERHSSERRYGSDPQNIGNLKQGPLSAVITSPPYADIASGGPDHHPERLEGTVQSVKIDSYGNSPGQIGRLPAGQIEAVITSPPFGMAQTGQGIAAEGVVRHPDGSTHKLGNNGYQKARHGQTSGNIGNLKQGEVSAILTSPPYAESIHDGNGIDKSKLTGNPAGPNSQAGAEGYGSTDGNIGNLKEGQVDAVVTSPPFEKSDARKPGPCLAQACAKYGVGTSHHKQDWQPSEGNLGNSAGETYWQAMKQVYGQCLMALKPGGMMAVVVKAYVKKGRIVDLPGDTLKLLVSLGFEPIERIHAMLTKTTKSACLFGGELVKTIKRVSFFRRLAEKKGSPPIDWEEVLWVRKPASTVERNSQVTGRP